MTDTTIAMYGSYLRYAEGSSDKQYVVLRPELGGDYLGLTNWGRTGSDGQWKAVNAWNADRILEAKIRKGYRLVPTRGESRVRFDVPADMHEAAIEGDIVEARLAMRERFYDAWFSQSHRMETATKPGFSTFVAVASFERFAHTPIGERFAAPLRPVASRNTNAVFEVAGSGEVRNVGFSRHPNTWVHTDEDMAELWPVAVALWTPGAGDTNSSFTDCLDVARKLGRLEQH